MKLKCPALPPNLMASLYLLIHINLDKHMLSALWPASLTWDVFGPADDDHQLAVGQVTQCGQCFDVALGHGGVRHGVDLLRLRYQQMGHDLRH